MLKTIAYYPHIAALRPHQWTKNLIVFAAPLFAFEIGELTIVRSLLAFVLFCCVSSSFYLLNDIADVDSDRRHPVKCKRPIAAGLVSIPVASCMAIGLLGGTLLISWRTSALLGTIVLSYALLQVSYNLKLKHTPILDIIAIAMGFVLRACAGAAINHITPSHWFLLCTAMLALFLGIEKRKAELRLAIATGSKTRAVLQQYSIELLTRMESVVTTSVVMSYSLWSSGPQLKGALTPWMFATLPFVLYGLFRYQLLSNPRKGDRHQQRNWQRGKRTERPEEVLLTDKPILFAVIGWVASVFTILLLEHQGILH
ncbi:decaprenyl-phosphate phosphoribosyltransferase [Oscillatoriales cyanobacterium LEGE 11467]|uniref:Decaprenyl-phosphate phosphoribosyltransferase n=2 Tax=Zarconia TaxID=2992130 RepID=A0A928ZAS2_9CYAN|nr:decaprenyl-phosphate phosphoribosyltransferase [Zarconia navalis LEGE 11467]